jgi:hypothetical protein
MEAVNVSETFCRTPLWNSSLTWYTDRPQVASYAISSGGLAGVIDTGKW